MTALSAALAGSSVCSAIVLSCDGCVGELPLGVAPMRIFRCEYDRMTPGPGPWPGGGVGPGGEMVGSNVYAPLPLRLGSGCCASLTSRKAGSMSSRRRRKSSVIRRKSCSSRLIRSSRRRSCSTRCLMSFRVAVAYCASASAATWQEHDKVSRTITQNPFWGAMLTQWQVVIALDGYVLCFLDVVDALQDGQPVADTSDAHALQVVVLQRHERLADDFVFCSKGFLVSNRSSVPGCLGEAQQDACPTEGLGPTYRRIDQHTEAGRWCR